MARAPLAAASLLGLMVAAYALVVLALGHEPDGDERTVLGLSAVATAAVALLYPRVRERVARAARRLVGSARPRLDDPLRLFTGRLSRAIPLEELLLQTAEALRRALSLTGAEIWTGSAGELERAVSDPERGPARISLAAEQPVVAREGVAGEGFARVWLGPLLEGREDALLRVAPAVRGGELLGLIVAERSATGQPFTDSESQMLGELARQVALALHNARLDSALEASLDAVRRQADELRASRARIVASADAERRRIERDLHDGAQQRLVGLMVRLEQAREADPATAGIQLSELKAEMQNALDEVRDLAHGIYPPLLSDGGLVEALSAAAARAPVPCTVRSDGVGRHPPQLEAAVYFCCLEALQNTAKHAGDGTKASISVREHPGWLVFRVEDDGAGFDPARATGGVGLTNMRDRLGAIGGHLEVESAVGEGASVGGSVPVSGSPATGRSAPPSPAGGPPPPT